MKTKLTTTIDKELLKQIKIYAAKHDIHINSIIEEHFKKLLENSMEK